jgi:hypothetical protein
VVDAGIDPVRNIVVKFPLPPIGTCNGVPLFMVMETDSVLGGITDPAASVPERLIEVVPKLIVWEAERPLNTGVAAAFTVTVTLDVVVVFAAFVTVKV